MLCEDANKSESVMSTELTIGGDHLKGEFRASIHLNQKFTSGINITRIFRIAHVQCKKENGDILDNTAMTPIWNRLKNICSGHFLGCTNKVKIQFIILSHGCPIPSPRGGGGGCGSVSPRVFFTGDLAFYAIVLGKEGSSPNWCFDFMLAPVKLIY